MTIQAIQIPKGSIVLLLIKLAKTRMKINNHNLVVPKVLLGMMEKVRTKFMIEDIEDDEFEGADSENE
jgi:hypothetical protein